jgi:hypothetical protein
MNSLLNPVLTPQRIRLARVIAVAADALQIMILPAVTVEGFVSPIEDVLDLAMAVTMILLLGWHWALLPGFISKLIPMVDLAPTWTIAVFVATGTGPAAAVGTPATPVTAVPVPPGQIGAAPAALKDDKRS